MKLNMGAGQNKVDGFVSVDKYGTPEVKCDLEKFPWPWGDSEVDEVLFFHSLEHMGASADCFIGIMKELYRVCANGAVISIAVPHPRHDHFLDDPTHVRVITPELMGCFSKRLNLKSQAAGSSNSQLAIYHGVDFDITGMIYNLDEPYRSDLSAGKITSDDVTKLLRKYNNVATECRIQLRVVKETKQ